MKQRLEIKFLLSGNPLFLLSGDRGSHGAVCHLSYHEIDETAGELPSQILEPLSGIRTTDELYRRLTRFADRLDGDRNYKITTEIKPYPIQEGKA